MEIRRLHCFMVVAEYLNFTKAAYQLCLSQSAVSRQIAALEEELGVQLFDRAPNSVRFTSEGQCFYAGLQCVLGDYDKLVSDIRQVRSIQVQNLDVGFLGGLERQLLPSLVKRLRESEHPVSLKVNRLDLFPLTLALENGEVDVAFTLALALPPASEIQHRLLFKERLVVLMSTDHRLAGRDTLRFEDLEGEAFLDLERPLSAPANALLFDICNRRGFRPRIVEHFHDLESLMLAIESGAGIGVLPKYRGDLNTSERLTYVLMDGPDSTVDYVVAWRKANSRAALMAFLHELGEVFTQI